MSSTIPVARDARPTPLRLLQWLAALLLIPCLAWGAPTATNVNGAQKAAIADLLSAVASGNPQELAYAVHPADLESLRQRLLTLMREESKRGENTIRSRLFGQARPLNELERLTSIDFYTTLARRLVYTGRRYEDAEWIASVPGDKEGETLVILRGKQARDPRGKDKDRPKTTILIVAALKPYGKDWKAALPSEVEAQIEDLISGRRIVPAGAVAMSAGQDLTGSPAKAPEKTPPPPGLREALDAAEKALAAGKCDEYYRQHMSPTFRKVTSKQALDALIGTCQRGIGTREMLLSTLRIVKDKSPKLVDGGSRAEYDVSDEGLPFDTFVLERVDDRWYIAE